MLEVYDVEARRRGKMKSDDRLLVLRPMQGRSPLDSGGAVDKRLFSGENNLHVIYDVNKGVWKMVYDMGALPGGLQGTFTTFTDAVNTARAYFKRRNIEIVEIKE